jgi:hypothetical protein
MALQERIQRRKDRRDNSPLTNFRAPLAAKILIVENRSTRPTGWENLPQTTAVIFFCGYSVRASPIPIWLAGALRSRTWLPDVEETTPFN